jgi:hypothetical protein
MDPSFYSGIALELVAKLRRLATFTGHPGSVGLHHEEVVREAIRPLLSARFSLRTGFLFAGPGVVSDQCDVVIVDEYDPSPYLFRLGDLVVVHPRAVAGVIEVKTVLSKQSFHGALQNLRRCREVARSAQPNAMFMTFVFAFEGAHFNADTLHDWYQSAPVPDNVDSYPQMIYVLHEGALDLKNFGNGVFGHRFIMGEEDDELKARSLSAFLQSIRKGLEIRAGIETNPFEYADLRNLSWSRQHLRIGVGGVDPADTPIGAA